MELLHPRAKRHLWLRIQVLDFEELTKEMGQAMTDRLRMGHTRADSQLVIDQGMVDLDTPDTLQFQLAGLRHQMTWKEFILALRLHNIREPLRRLCYRLIAFTIAGRGQAPEKVTTIDLYYLRSMDERTVNVPYLLAHYLFRYAEVRKQGPKIFGGHFIARLTEHFGLITEESLRGLTVVVRDLTMINMDELVRLHIYERLLGILNWDQRGSRLELWLKLIRRTIPQRLQRLEEEVHRLRESFRKKRVVVDGMSRDFARFTTWVVGCLGQLLDASGVTYLRYGDSHVPY
nr:hypothetical protein [Tanacetum cinerariifolium]